MRRAARAHAGLGDENSRVFKDLQGCVCGLSKDHAVCASKTDVQGKMEVGNEESPKKGNVAGANVSTRKPVFEKVPLMKQYVQRYFLF